MTMDEILTGDLEDQIREEMQMLHAIVPPGTKYGVAIHINNDNSGFITACATLGGHDIGQSYLAKSVRQAFGAVVSQITSPNAIQNQRDKIQEEIERLQQALDSIPQPIAIKVMEAV